MAASLPVAGDAELIGRAEQRAAIQAAMADPECGMCLVTGAAGVGKTRLLGELDAALRGRGRQVRRAFGLPPSASFPFATIAHLLPTGAVEAGALDPLRAFLALRSVVWSGDGDADPWVLLVDDIHLADPASIAVIAQLVSAGLVMVVGTVRSGEPIPEAVSAMAVHGRARWVEVRELDRTESDRLVADLLGSTVDPRLCDAVWERTLGNPLFVRELVAASVQAGGIVEVDGCWTLGRRLVPSRQLAETVMARLSALDPRARTVMEFVALTEPLPLVVGAVVLDPDLVSALVDRGLVIETSGDHDQHWRCGHPLFGEVLRRPMSSAHAQAVLAATISSFELPASASPVLATQVTGWRLQAGLSVTPDEFARALSFAEAGWDWGLCARLARAGIAQALPGAMEARSQALHLLGRHREVIEEARVAARVETDPGRLLEWLHIEARALFWGDGDYPGAAAAMQRAADVAGPRRRVRQVDVVTAVELAWAGSLEALDQQMATFAATGLIGDPDPVIQLLILVAQMEAARQRGDLHEAMELADRGSRLATHHHVGAARAGRFRTLWCAALTDAGRSEQAARIAHDDAEQARAVGAVVPLAWTAWCLGRALADLGRLASAEQWLITTRDLARTHQLEVCDALATAGMAVVASQRDDAAVSKRLLAELADRPCPPGFVGEELARGLAWARWGAGQRDGAVDGLRQLVLGAHQRGFGGSVVRSMVALCRMGDGAWVADHGGLFAAARHPHGPAVLDHAGGIRDDDPVMLERASEQYRATGLILPAAETLTAAGASWRRRGEQRAAKDAAERATRLQGACEGLVVSGTVVGDGPTPLTRREQEIASLAASGLASKEISSRLFLSTRTVDNHLSNVYVKLGVSGRHELSAALVTRSR